MAGTLRAKIDSEIFKLDDQRVRLLLSAKLSIEAFALLVRPGDPYVLIDDTVYALTETEFYALHAVLPPTTLSEKAFQYVMALQDLSFMSNADAEAVANIKAALPGCPSCQYARYKNQIAELIKKYSIKVPADSPLAEQGASRPRYPKTSDAVQSKVTGLLRHMYDVPSTTRRPCMDCVEKHLAQAWVLAAETLQGYPEHVTYVIGHLGEALNELPPELTALASTLTYCLARTNYNKRPFVPLGAILPILHAGRKELALDAADPEDDKMPLDDTLLQLDLPDTAKTELGKLTDDAAASLAAYCSEVDKIIPRVENSGDLAAVEWEGAMGVLADRLVDTAPAVANVVRNRRLMFKADPRTAAEAGYTLVDLSLALSQLVDGDAGNSDGQSHTLP